MEVEHIIQDAGSGKELCDWAATHPHIRFFEEADTGMYDAINRGLRRATGDVCAYLNCDEQYLPGALRRVSEFFELRRDVDVLFGDVVLVSETGWPLSYRRAILPDAAHLRASHLNTSSCATFFRRHLLERGLFFDPNWRAIGDLIWVNRLITHGAKMATLPEALAVFTFTGENLGTSATSREESDRWKATLGAGKKFAAMSAIVQHRMRKFLAGAYRRRDVEVAIYTHCSPTIRERIAAGGVGFGWPK